MNFRKLNFISPLIKSVVSTLRNNAAITKANTRIVIYTDGTFKNNKTGYAWIAVKDNKIIAEASGTVANDGSRNVTGEIYAAISGLSWAHKSGYRKVVVRHDYEGVGHWATNRWNANLSLTQNYKEFIKSLPFTVKFEWVRGHGEDPWNNYVDALAATTNQK